MAPVGQWVFFALATNTQTQKQNGFRYTLPSTSTQYAEFATRSPPAGLFYDLNSGGSIFVGGDPFNALPNFSLQYFRVYLDYFAASTEEMLSLAIMNTGNIFHMKNEIR